MIIGVFGGSVAKHFAIDGGGLALEARLRESGLLDGVEIEIVSLGLAGYKQPQQLMTLNYVLASGGEFDILVCLDGFNEVVLQFEGRGHDRVAPPFPRNWHLRIEKLPNPKLQKIIGERAYLTDQRDKWNRSLYSVPLRYSPIATLIRRLGDSGYAGRLNELQFAFEDDESASLSYEAAGPRSHWSSDLDELTRELVDIWARSSVQMHHIAEGNGAQLLVFLQPNQHVLGSMPQLVSEPEALSERHLHWRESVRRGYPLLIQAGADLAQQGVRFHDLTDIYAKETESPYIDECCHVDLHGNEMIASAIADAIIPTLKSKAHVNRQ